MPMRPRHKPRRMCVGCRTSDEKRALLRLVRTPDGVVCYDPTGKALGRGAYVCADAACIETARKKRSLARQLSAPVSDAVYDVLLALVNRLPDARESHQTGA